MLRIVIADDNDQVRRYVHEALEDETDWKVCGEAATGREAVRLTEELKPDVVVLDLSMPEGNGMDATREIHKNFPNTEILILTMHASPELNLAAVAAGATACLLKSDLNSLMNAVRLCTARSSQGLPQ
jgi:DNA-binding NarL/FixJ family response regulator